VAEFDVRRVLGISAGLGEGALWSVEEQALFWVDIYKSTFNRFDPVSGSNHAWSLPSPPGSFAFRDGGAIIAATNGYLDIDFATGAIKLSAPAPYDPAMFRFNDGKADRQGRFWAGTILQDYGGPERGRYFRYEKGAITASPFDISVANGTAFSPDGRTMYRAETIERKIFVLDYDTETGAPSNQRLFAETPRELGIPDGATVDSEGFYWAATPFGKEYGSVARFSPEGELVLHFPTPVMMPTMVAFGGPNLSTLYITTGTSPRNRRPTDMDGDLFAVETPFRGLPEALCRA
jgi:sugar lactone lactonase YvrE